MALALRLSNWRNLLRTARQRPDMALLDARHIYILPSRLGMIFGLIVLAMLIGSMNYTLSLGYMLTFMLAGIGVVAMLHTWRNLAHLAVVAGKTSPVFVGETAHFTILPSDTLNRVRLAIGANLGRDASKLPAVYTDIPAMGRGELVLTLPAKQRGWLELGRVTLFTEFPLGLFHVWSYAEVGARCLVYPQPAPPGLPLPAPLPANSGGSGTTTGGDEDFSGLRDYQMGDSPRRVDWKASARASGLLTKQFHGEARAWLWLDWSLLPGLSPEQRIAQLTRWVLDAHAGQLVYGLRLPNEELAPDCGEAHFHRCLEMLALYGSH